MIKCEEEKARVARNNRAIREFSNIINDLCLVDLPLQGGNFTWFRSRNHLCASRFGQVSYFNRMG